jgi:N-acetylglutamate synthase-like GNAT family acetyltransferase
MPARIFGYCAIQTYFQAMALMQIEHGSDKYEQMVKLRDDVLRKPLGLSFTTEHLEKEKDDILIGAFDDGRILGCCILTPQDSSTIKLRQMAVANKQQHKGIGFSILQFAENLARDKGYKTMTMHARDTAIGFYQKQGYKLVGDVFMEVTVPHHVMEKKLR